MKQRQRKRKNVIKKTTVNILFILVLFWACQSEEKPINTLFTKLDVSFTGVDFVNSLEFDSAFNIYTYRNYYNGGGVAIGDINNDGLVDIYFSANQKPNRLFLNKGNLTFEDISSSSGVQGDKAWSTGVAMADVNGDGWLDIYVCNSGDVQGDNKQNELFINNGDLTFTEQAEEYGLADKGLSTHIAFFDYDKDGDLDAYLLNNSFKAIGTFNQMNNIRDERDSIGGDKLYRNDNGRFKDVSESAGIYGSIIGFGLGVTVGDVNLDGWQDIFVSNDFFERDYLYINNQDGTFDEVLESRMNSISAASMGADMADINNDGYPEIFVTDMLPEPLKRLKQVTTFENWDKITYNVKNGYHYQYNRNMLHLNNGDGTFSEIARLAGVEATDWSWGALFFDADNDGLKDIFVANGIYQDITDLDYLNFIADDETKAKIITANGVDYSALIDPIPITPIPNYFFRNEGGLRFSNFADQWGLSEPVHSNGSAYGDLDNDGDLDLVVNNLNTVSSIYKNNSDRSTNNYLRIKLRGEGKNTQAIGTKIKVVSGTKVIYAEQMPIRGFQSSIDPTVLMGLGEIQAIDSLVVTWPSFEESVLSNVRINQTLDIKEGGNPIRTSKKDYNTLFKVISPPDFTHKENSFVDFDRDRLTYHMLSTQGPKFTIGDINNDGMPDMYVGGAKGQPGALLVQSNQGFEVDNQTFLDFKRHEDTDAIFLDVDSDGDQDLFVTSGGNEFTRGTPELRDRLYINEGGGIFSSRDLPFLRLNLSNSSTVSASDIDGDGDLDVFIGSRTKVFEYGMPPDSYVLLNDGAGNFVDGTMDVAPGLKKLGMISDSEFVDIDNDNDQDLVVLGEWLSPKVFLNERGSFKEASTSFDSLSGWWNTVKSADLDNDGDSDLIFLNHGLNSRFDASFDKPLRLYVNDFDGNGTIEHIFCQKEADKYYPLTLKHELVAQLPQLKKTYLKYQSYNDRSIDQIFKPELLNQSVKHEVNFLRSIVAINNGDSFEIKELPIEAQMAPMFGVAIDDFDGDGIADLLIGGNFFEAKPEAGRYDASYGHLLKGLGDGSFVSIRTKQSGFQVTGQVRDIAVIGQKVFVARNNNTVLSFAY